jgi:two-component system response regulator AtoC
MKKIIHEIEHIAKSNANVFITGETGTGKEVIAHLIHYNSLRNHKPFIKVNCAAIPDALVESEFFGHEKGAFTGAVNKRLGRFELAHGGSLLLDEVTEIPLHLQAKLLRITQEEEFERIGGSKSIQVDVRLISTSNRSMREAIANKVIREDLYYRLNVVPIHLPPLRERKEDIVPLANYFIERTCMENHLDRKKLSADAEKKLLLYPWPGNVRELANVIERAIVMGDSKIITGEQLMLEGFNLNGLGMGKTLAELERQLIVETLQTHQNELKAAETLGISLKKFKDKLVEHDLGQ